MFMGKVIVVGAGPAGMMAAGKAAENGNEVHIFEQKYYSWQKNIHYR